MKQQGETPNKMTSDNDFKIPVTRFLHKCYKAKKYLPVSLLFGCFFFMEANFRIKIW